MIKITNVSIQGKTLLMFKLRKTLGNFNNNKSKEYIKIFSLFSTVIEQV